MDAGGGGGDQNEGSSLFGSLGCKSLAANPCSCCSRLAAFALNAKGLDPLDRSLADATVKRSRDVLLLSKRKGVVRLVGLQRARSSRWALVER